MTSATAIIHTTSGSRYLQQLCKHWSHKFDTAFDASQGRVALPIGTAEMAASPKALTVTCTAPQADNLPRLEQVVADHLNRFAFREAPLQFDWRRV